MTDAADTPTRLEPEEAARLTDFARACKAAARSVLLYPPAHPAIAATLGRLVQLTAPPTLTYPLSLTVLPDGILLDGRAPAKPDASLGELAELLHAHRVGELTVQPGGDLEAWRAFLLLLGRTPESVRAEGGISRLWITQGGRHVQLKEIDYAEVLRERAGGEAAAWEQIIASCLQGDKVVFDEEELAALLEIASDPDRLTALLSSIGERADERRGTIATSAALLQVMRRIIETLSERQPEKLEPTLRNMATAVGQLSPETLMALLSHEANAAEGAPHVVASVVSRMPEPTIVQFVARHVATEDTPTERLAQVFQTLVRDEHERPRLLALAREQVAASPLGQTQGFDGVWNHVAEKLLTSYSDEPFVSTEYGRELSRSRTQAVDVEQAKDDPPERVSAWLGTVSTTALRSLDVALLLDLLRIEEDPDRWGELMAPVMAFIEDLLLVGDLDAATALLDVIVREAGPEAVPGHRQHALIAIDMLAAGSMLGHLVTHLATIDDVQFARVKAVCAAMGEVMVKPLAEALSVEQRSRTRERLTAMLLAFGAVGRLTAERLKSSPNAAVRRTAIYILREFGGSDALPDLTELLDDNEPQVQREAVRAILNIGTDAAYDVLRQALASGTEQSRDAIMQAVAVVRDERAAPLFVYILRRLDHKGPLGRVYLRAIESLGQLRDPEAIAPLKEALYRGEWWAPRRTATVRRAAAEALARIGTAEARAVLEEAERSGPRGVRAAARAQSSRVNARLAR